MYIFFINIILTILKKIMMGDDKNRYIEYAALTIMNCQ